ncbi:MAG TPA: GNAT family N-acetyltransferase [Candidatus Acidoferrum sp.]|jgi:ribosomal protein S18 acetylase RimI-like enzyme|nr:GNAT family N-acetyltransferase [Candidatus Acidoferrum sp.]
MHCEYCGESAVYRCCVCGRPVCSRHTRLGTICPSCTRKATVKFAVHRATSNKEKEKVKELVKRFWGEEEQLTFNRKFFVAELPAYVAKVREDVVGFVSFADLDNSLVIVALGILPKYQNAGIGRSLMKKVEAEAEKLRKKRLLVSTSNDDLPALAFYQSLGFQIFEVKPNVIAKKHGEVLSGIGGLPIRDELRLQKILA